MVSNAVEIAARDAPVRIVIQVERQESSPAAQAAQRLESADQEDTFRGRLPWIGALLIFAASVGGALLVIYGLIG